MPADSNKIGDTRVINSRVWRLYEIELEGEKWMDVGSAPADSPQLEREAFIDAMLARFEECSPGAVDRAYAVNVLDGFLDMEGPLDKPGTPMEYGQEDYDWSAVGAAILADEDMQYWESDNAR